MPRIARIVAIGYPHHITQRGNYRQDVFLDDNDRKQYLSYLEEYSHRYGTSILAYCLMLNHVHFIAIPNAEDSLAKTFKAAHMRYSQYFNKKIKATGHLWQGRFYSCILDEPHLIVAARYIERNPVRAKMVQKPWQWEWSSASAHIRDKTPQIKLKDFFEYIDMDDIAWKRYIDAEEDEKTLKNIRKHTLTGRPLGAVAFIEKLEKGLGKKLRVLTKGRPRKSK